MTERSLTGVWQGLFTYPDFFEAGHFSATLIQTASQFSGSTSEIYAFWPRKGETVLAMLSGFRDDNAIGFTKTYEGPDEPNHSVEYVGTLTQDGMEIEGRWYIPGDWSGRFLMIRSGGRSIDVARKELERSGI